MKVIFCLCVLLMVSNVCLVCLVFCFLSRKVEVTHKFATPKTLVQQYLFIPAKHKDCYLAYVLNEFAGQSTIVFVSTCNNAQVTKWRPYY